MSELDQEKTAGDALPAWPGPLTANSTWRDVEARLDHHIAERRERTRHRRDTSTQVGVPKHRNQRSTP